MTPWTAAHQASLSITNSQSLHKLMSIESVMPSNHLILCHPLLLLPSILPSIRVFSNESALRITWPKYWSFSFSIGPSNEYSGLIPFKTDWLDLLGGGCGCNRRTEHGREELPQVRGQGQKPGGHHARRGRPRRVTPHPRSGAAAESARLRWHRNGREELPKSKVRGGRREEIITLRPQPCLTQ